MGKIKGAILCYIRRNVPWESNLEIGAALAPLLGNYAITHPIALVTSTLAALVRRPYSDERSRLTRIQYVQTFERLVMDGIHGLIFLDPDRVQGPGDHLLIYNRRRAYFFQPNPEAQRH